MMIRKVYLIVNPKKDPDGMYHERVCTLLGEKGIEFIEPDGSSDTSAIDPDAAYGCDAIFTVGGDGTLIQAARELSDIDKPFFPINIGTLGYMTETTMETASSALDRLLSGQYRIQERMRLHAFLPAGEEMTALNDVVIARTGEMHSLDFNLWINGKLVHTYSADGIIIATPTGSTGYNLSAGGAIVDPQSQMIVVTPICPHTIRPTSLVVSGDDELTIEVLDNIEQGTNVAISVDGGRMLQLAGDDKVKVCRSYRKTALIRFDDDSFLDALFKKMKD